MSPTAITTANLGRFLDAKTFHIERLYPGPPEGIWDYLTQPRLIASWFAEARLEPRVNGKIELKSVTEYEPERKLSGDVARGIIKEFDPPHTLAYTWNDQHMTNTLLTFSLKHEGEHARLILTLVVGTMTDPDKTEELIVASASGWHILFDRLEAAIEGETPESFVSAVPRLHQDYVKLVAARPGGPRLGISATS